jgi:hypothetical protein
VVNWPTPTRQRQPVAWAQGPAQRSGVTRGRLEIVHWHTRVDTTEMCQVCSRTSVVLNYKTVVSQVLPTVSTNKPCRIMLPFSTVFRIVHP